MTQEMDYLNRFNDDAFYACLRANTSPSIMLPMGMLKQRYKYMKTITNQEFTDETSSTTGNAAIDTTAVAFGKISAQIPNGADIGTLTTTPVEIASLNIADNECIVLQISNSAYGLWNCACVKFYN